MPDWVVFLIGQAGMVAGVYAAIRADLREAMTRASMAEHSANEAHKRLDDLLMERRK